MAIIIPKPEGLRCLECGSKDYRIDMSLSCFVCLNCDSVIDTFNIKLKEEDLFCKCHVCTANFEKHSPK